MIAIALHKGAAAMSLGISLYKTFDGDFRLILQLLIAFSLATPIGITIGLILGEASAIVSISFSCLAGGTFVYISCSEVVVEEFSIPGNKWIKLFAYIFGATIITCLWFIDAD